MLLKIGTRASRLAIKQTKLVIDKIKIFYPKISCEIIPIITTADKIQDRNLYDIGGKALFLKELEEALDKNIIDIAVHSLKDVPGVIDSNFKIAAVLEREDPREVLITKQYSTINDLSQGAKIGTSSVRRKAFLLRQRADLEIVTFRGNIDSRLRKILVEQQVSASLLTAAGLKRLGLFDPAYCHIIEPDDIIPAPGQGVIGIEIKQDTNILLQELCNKINHLPTFTLMQTERAFVEYLNASCDTPLAAYARYIGNRIEVDFMLEQGGEMKFYSTTGKIAAAKQMGVKAAKILLGEE